MSDWFGFDREDFLWNGYECIIVRPAQPLPGNPFVWRTEFFGAFAAADLEMVKRGYALTYVRLSDKYGNPWAVERMHEYYLYLTRERGFGEGAILFGFSRGGLYAMNFALTHPECVDKIYLDAPVLDVTSWPGGMGKGVGSREREWGDCLACYGETEESVFDCLAARPVKRGDEFASLGIPLAVIAGNADDVVPYTENAMPFINDFLRAGGKLYIRVKPACGHHPHSFEDADEIGALTDFLCKRTRK